MHVGGKNTKALLEKSYFVEAYIQRRRHIHKTLSKERGCGIFGIVLNSGHRPVFTVSWQERAVATSACYS